jgi:hypothetical protein
MCIKTTQKKYHGNNREKCVLTSLLFEERVNLLAQLFLNSHLKKAHREGLNIKQHENRHKKRQYYKEDDVV